jgi:hypothetical protein
LAKPTNDTYRKLLRTVSELHVRGYQRLRISPGMAASGMYWRCPITPVTNISRTHGARMVSWDGPLVVPYTSGQEKEYFGIKGIGHLTASRLADLFVSRFPDIAKEGAGSDWLYAGWYLEMLHLTYPARYPIAYADWDLPSDLLATVGDGPDVSVPLPPPGLGLTDPE